MDLSVESVLPEDADGALLVGRVWQPGDPDGPRVVRVGRERLDALPVATVAELFESVQPADLIREAPSAPLGDTAQALANSRYDARRGGEPFFLAPCDLQAVKASGVTFAASLLERVIEEQARGRPEAASAIRKTLMETVGGSLRGIVPGSPAAVRLKETLVEQGAWSQYLEVGIGPDAEIFTKSQPMSAVGVGAEVGLHPASAWNNPEPEVVLFVNSRGEAVGAALGNDVNLRDIEGRSALLLGKAKDNNGSCAIGPFIRVFDEAFSIDDVRSAEIDLIVEGDDGFRLTGASSMTEISRDPLDIVAQMMGAHHQYPDGAVLFLGTMFAPVEDRDKPGEGFTHKPGDIVTIASPRFGSLVNRVDRSDRIPPWTFGTSALMRNLAARGLLGRGLLGQ